MYINRHTVESDERFCPPEPSAKEQMIAGLGSQIAGLTYSIGKIEQERDELLGFIENALYLDKRCRASLNDIICRYDSILAAKESMRCDAVDKQAMMEGRR